MPDQVNCERLAEEEAVFERVYDLGALPRFKDLLAVPRGVVRARFAFAKAAGRPVATVAVEATPLLVCQRCMQEFALSLRSSSEIEFAYGEELAGAAAERELFRMENGVVSLRELAEEELLLALPVAPACSTPLTCGKAPVYATDEQGEDATGEMRRPFGELKNLLKKT